MFSEAVVTVADAEAEDPAEVELDEAAFELLAADDEILGVDDE